MVGQPGGEPTQAPTPAPSFSHEVATIILNGTGLFSLVEAEMVTDITEHLYRLGQVSEEQVRYIAHGLQQRVDVGEHGDAVAALLRRLRALIAPPADVAALPEGPGCFLGYERHAKVIEE